MKRLKFTTILAVLFLLLTVSFAGAGLITFETDPDGNTPVDDSQLTSSYSVNGLGVSFGFYSSGGIQSNAVFEQIGDDSHTGFWNDTGYDGGVKFDKADPGYEAKLGNFFLRQPTGYSDFGIFRIKYSDTVATAASGEIWDIDGGTGRTEQYTVVAYDAAEHAMQTLTSPLGDSYALDGRPWVFHFTGLANGIDHIDIDFTGSKTGGIGLAFNNFSPTSAVPIPGAMWLLGSGLLGLLGIRRKKA